LSEVAFGIPAVPDGVSGPIQSWPSGADSLLRLPGWRRPRIVPLQKIQRAAQESQFKTGISDFVVDPPLAAGLGIRTE